jgi:hypothetical protein
MFIRRIRMDAVQHKGANDASVSVAAGNVQAGGVVW